MNKLLITGIEATKRGRFSVYLDDEFYCALHADVFARAGLSPGGEIAPEEIEALRRASEQRITRERALRLLSGRGYTEQGLYRKLCERAEEEDAAAAVARMRELGLLDDADYARRFAADCQHLKGYAHPRILRELVQKGIDRELAEETVAAMDEDAEQAIARTLLRRHPRCLEEGDEKALRRAVNALQRLGYRYGDIRTVIENLREDREYYETDD